MSDGPREVPLWRGVASARRATTRARALAARAVQSQTGSNAGWLLLDRVVRQGGSLLLNLLIARYLGVRGWGVLSYAAALASFAAAVANAGIDAVVVRDLVRSPERRLDVLGSALVVRLASGAVAVLGVVGVAWRFAPDPRDTVPVTVLLCLGVMFQAFDVTDLWFQAARRVRAAALARLAVFAASLALRGAILAGSGGVLAVATVTAGEGLLATGALAIAYRRAGQRMSQWRLDWGSVRALAREGWPLCLSGLAVMVYMRIDVVMLGAMSGTREVGLYGAATRLSEAWYLVPTSVAAAVAPAIITAHAQDRRAYLILLRRLLRGLTLTAIAVAVVLTATAGPVVGLVFGSAYRGAEAILAIHVWSGVFVAAGVAQGTWSVCEGLTRLVLLRTVVGAIVNVVLNLVFIPAFAGVGAALATLIAYALSAVVLNALDYRTRGFFWLQIQALGPAWLPGRRRQMAGG